MSANSYEVTVVGAGLAGCELALQLADSGVRVRLIEMKPERRTEAAKSDNFAELVCSNSLKAIAVTNASGLLKEEMRLCGSFLLRAAQEAAIPAGGALAVDREKFGRLITELLSRNSNVAIETRAVNALPPPEEGETIIATGPLSTEEFQAALRDVVGGDNLYFYDAIAPIVSADSIDMNGAFAGSRYDKGGDDYLNLPMNESEYKAFVAAVLAADKVKPRQFEEPKYFEGCLPIETLCERGGMTLAFGAMKPVGLSDPRSVERPFAVAQLRKENAEGSAYNMVGFQTRMTYGAQDKVFRLIPALRNAEFLRYGSVHRNTFINSPALLDDSFRLKSAPHIRFAGQITGVEGYVESIAIGLLIGIMMRAERSCKPFSPPPGSTALGALYRHTRLEKGVYQPSNAHFGLFNPISGRFGKKFNKKEVYARVALENINEWIKTL